MLPKAKKKTISSEILKKVLHEEMNDLKLFMYNRGQSSLKSFLLMFQHFLMAYNIILSLN